MGAPSTMTSGLLLLTCVHRLVPEPGALLDLDAGHAGRRGQVAAATQTSRKPSERRELARVRAVEAALTQLSA